MSAVAIIPARGGSRRIPRKNIRFMLGRRVIEYSIAAARDSGVCGEVWVSTEDAHIARVAWQAGCKLHPRAPQLAEDAVGTQEVMRQALKELWPSDMSRPEFAVCIYPVAPTLLASDLREGFMRVCDAKPYAYVPGMFYFGLSEAFIKGVPLEAGERLMLGAREIDVNEEAEWQQAKKILQGMRA